MPKPKMLKKGDKIAVVSLSSGCIGDPSNISRFEAGKKALEENFGVKVVAMPNALKGSEWVAKNPQARAKDLMNAFKDKSINGIICATGGTDTVRLLPYIDFDTIKKNPKVFMGFSDTTANHFMMQKAGLVSFYGPALAVEFSLKNVEPTTIETTRQTLFEYHSKRELKHLGILADDPKDWSDAKLQIEKDNRGYELLQGNGKVVGKIVGGCIEEFVIINGTKIWPTTNGWKNKILAIETSDEQAEPWIIKDVLINLGAQGVFDKISGIIVGRPKNGKFYEEYKNAITETLAWYNKPNLPVLCNCHFGHAWLWNILPIGCKIEIDCDKKTLTLLESGVKK